MADITGIRVKLKNSLDAQVLRNYLKFALAIVAVGVVFFLVTLHMLELPVRIGTALLLSGVIVAPILIWCGWFAVRIYGKPEAYILGRVTLDKPEGTYWKTMRFRVILQTENGRQIQARTHPIFQNLGWMGPNIENYINREVEVVYNDETDVLVIL